STIAPSTFTDTHITQIYTLSLHDALPISVDYNDGSNDRVQIKNEIMAATGLNDDLIEWWIGNDGPGRVEATVSDRNSGFNSSWRSEEHTSELQSRFDLVCRLLLEKKKKKK